MSGFAIQASTMEDMPQPSFQLSFSITNAITTALTQIERARGFLEAATLSEQWVRAMGGKGGWRRWPCFQRQSLGTQGVARPNWLKGRSTVA